MEQYNDKQIQVFHGFYQACRSKKLDPLSSEVDRQRTVLLAQDNAELKKIFGAQLDEYCTEAYRLGKEYAENKAAAEKQAQDEAKRAEARRKDESAAALEREIAQTRGRGKRLYFLRKGVESADKEIAGARQEQLDAVKLWDSLNKLEQQQESSWGTLGGIAAGITGSTAVGAAVASDTMSKNAQIQARNKEISHKNLKLTQPLVDGAMDRQNAAREKIVLIEAEIGNVKLHLMEEKPLGELMDSITLSKPTFSFTEGGTMLIRTTLSAPSEYAVAGTVPAVIDGSFMAEVYEGEQKIGCAWLNLPRDGASGSCELNGLCLEAKQGTSYTVVIIPLGLWLIEKYTPPVIKYTLGHGRGRQNLEYSIPDLDILFPTYSGHHEWASLPLYRIPWQQRLAELERERAEAERAAAEAKAEAERKAVERARKAKLAAIIAVPCMIALVIVGVLLSNASKARAEEAARLEAYDAAVALADAGSYDEAINAFTQLGDYKDSAEQITETSYKQAVALLDNGAYTAAINAFTALGNYKDSAEMIVNAQEQQTEAQYQTALGHLNDGNLDWAVDILSNLGSYKDSADIIRQIENERQAWNDAMAAFEYGDFETVQAAVNNKYIKLDQNIIDLTAAGAAYAGEWEYLSGDSKVLTMAPLAEHLHKECDTIAIQFFGYLLREQTVSDADIVVYYNGTHETYSVDPDTGSLLNYYSFGHFTIEHSGRDTLIITLERDSGEIVTAEYQRLA